MTYLYIMLSRTDTRMGKFIRTFTRGTYNHVSLTLDDSLRSFVSFARYRVDIPLAGGYIREDAERLLHSGKPLPVVIYRLPISRERYLELETLFSMAGSKGCGLIYNSLGAAVSWLRLPCPVPGAYTCLEFANRVLGTSCRSIQALEASMGSERFFQGDLGSLISDSGNRDESFFCRRGFFRGTGDTLSHFARLAMYLLRLRRTPDPIASLSPITKTPAC